MAYLDFSKAFDTIDHNIFIKTIKHIDNILQCKTLLYANDMILLSSHQDVGIATTQLQNDLTKLDTCCFDNKLSINYKKTKTMIF